MMRYLRLRASLAMSLALLAAACTIALEGAAQVAAAPPQDIGAEIFRWAMGSGVVLLGAIWTLMQYHLRRMDELQSKLVGEAITRALAHHNEDKHAHPETTTPLLKTLHEIERKLDRLVVEHDYIAGRCGGGGAGK